MGAAELVPGVAGRSPPSCKPCSSGSLTSGKWSRGEGRPGSRGRCHPECGPTAGRGCVLWAPACPGASTCHTSSPQAASCHSSRAQQRDLLLVLIPASVRVPLALRAVRCLSLPGAGSLVRPLGFSVLLRLCDQGSVVYSLCLKPGVGSFCRLATERED